LNEGPHVIGFLPVLSTPDSLQYLSVQQDLARITRQVRKHFELAWRQPHLLSVHSRAAGGEVDLESLIAVGLERPVRSGGDTSQQRLDTRKQLRNAERFEAWIHRILVHACYAEAKRASRWSANVVILPVDGPATPDTTLDIVTRDALDRGFRRLPAEQRAAFVLHHHLGWSVPEIAENLGVPAETIKSRLRYATSTLRAALDADARTTSPTSLERMA